MSFKDIDRIKKRKTAQELRARGQHIKICFETRSIDELSSQFSHRLQEQIAKEKERAKMEIKRKGDAKTSPNIKAELKTLNEKIDRIELMVRGQMRIEPMIKVKYRKKWINFFK